MGSSRHGIRAWGRWVRIANATSVPWGPSGSTLHGWASFYGKSGILLFFVVPYSIHATSRKKRKRKTAQHLAGFEPTSSWSWVWSCTAVLQLPSHCQYFPVKIYSWLRLHTSDSETQVTGYKQRVMIVVYRQSTKEGNNKSEKRPIY